jgi:hypothetical protein
MLHSHEKEARAELLTILFQLLLWSCDDMDLLSGSSGEGHGHFHFFPFILTYETLCFDFDGKGRVPQPFHRSTITHLKLVVLVDFRNKSNQSIFSFPHPFHPPPFSQHVYGLVGVTAQHHGQEKRFALQHRIVGAKRNMFAATETKGVVTTHDHNSNYPHHHH